MKGDGTLVCWGENISGQTTVPAGSYTEVRTGEAHTCAIKSDGSLACWGENSSDQGSLPLYIYGIDFSPPTVVSSLRVDPSPTSASSVDYTVTFSEFVTGVDISDFGVQTSIGLGASVTGVVGAGDTYTVTVDTGTAAYGTLRLDVLDNDSIRDAVNLPLNGGYTSAEVYEIDKRVILFQDDFETGDFSLWTRFNDGNGYLYPCTNAAMNDSWGACVERGTDKRKQLIDETPVNQEHFSVRFNIDMNTIMMDEGTRFRFMQVKMGAERPFFIVLKRQGGEFLIQLNTLLDDLTKAKTAWYPLSILPHTIEVEWEAASGPGVNNGGVILYVDGIIQPSETRQRVCSCLEVLENKRDENPPKKHGNIPL